jgi:hypothetical protein
VTIPDSIVPPIPATNSQPEVRTLKPGAIYVYDREEDKNFFIGDESRYTMTASTSGLTAKLSLATDLDRSTPLQLESSPSAFTRLQASSSAQTAALFKTYHTPLYSNTLQWMPDSRHLLYDSANQVQVLEYDGNNDTTVYSGPFQPDFIYPWPDGSKVLVVTSFSTDSPANLYAVELK